ncbi:hypothetical protein [Brevibacterium oceani]|uniref:hypothetical protein n=1 Tax=Brevibacterium oceani TaxID=358099 RepID=UPI0015E67B74|nr:hypothetical protein [Brevibacterium oceani]
MSDESARIVELAETGADLGGPTAAFGEIGRGSDAVPGFRHVYGDAPSSSSRSTATRRPPRRR